MFEQLFASPRVIREHEEAPYRAERERYLEDRLKQGYRLQGLRLYARELLWAARKLVMDPEHGVNLQELEAVAQTGWAERERRSGQVLNTPWTAVRFIDSIRPWLRLITSMETDHPEDIRDRPIVMLCAIYGFRASEVASLRLEDLDWEHNLLSVQRCKRRGTQVYPLVPSVGNAILRYLCELRPHSPRREVFLTHHPPFRPLSGSALFHVISPRLTKLGIRALHRGAHALRHACAEHLVAEGFSLKEIGDHLGHRSAEATRIYAKVDLASLREVARFDLGGLS